MSLRLDFAPPPPPPPNLDRGGGHTRLRWREWGEPIQTTGQNLQHSPYSVVCTMIFVGYLNISQANSTDIFTDEQSPPPLSIEIMTSCKRLYCLLGTSDFDVQMSGIKFQKGDENLRPIYKNVFFFEQVEQRFKTSIFLY